VFFFTRSGFCVTIKIVMLRVRNPHLWLAAALVLGSVVAAAGEASATPDLSLKATMRSMQSALSRGDAKELQEAFLATKRKARPEFARWAEIADAGVAAASAKNMQAVKDTCKDCHDLYQQKYRERFGSKAP
jgi:hypothetical protein